MKRPRAALLRSGASFNSNNLASASVLRGHRMKHHLLPVSPTNAHWGYFSKKVAPALTLKSSDRATIETLTHHANDHNARLSANDPAAATVFHKAGGHKP